MGSKESAGHEATHGNDVTLVVSHSVRASVGTNDIGAGARKGVKDKGTDDVNLVPLRGGKTLHLTKRGAHNTEPGDTGNPSTLLATRGTTPLGEKTTSSPVSVRTVRGGGVQFTKVISFP